MRRFDSDTVIFTFISTVIVVTDSIRIFQNKLFRLQNPVIGGKPFQETRGNRQGTETEITGQNLQQSCPVILMYCLI